MKKLLAFLTGSSHKRGIVQRQTLNAVELISREKGNQMSDIQVLSTGRIFKQVDNTLAEVLCEAFPTDIRRCRDKKQDVDRAATTAPVWTVGRAPYNDNVVFIQVSLVGGRRVERFCDEPANAAAFFQDVAGLQVPAEIMERFVALRSQRIGRVEGS